MRGSCVYVVRGKESIVLSKGILIKKRSKNRIVIQNYGGGYALNGKKAQIWLIARQGFIPTEKEDIRLVSELCVEGLMLETDIPNSYGMYFLLSGHALGVRRRKGLRFPLFGIEKEIVRWYQNGKRSLRLEELIFLIENKVNPLDYEYDEFGVALSERINPSRIQINNRLKYEMLGAKKRDDVVNAVLRLFAKNRMYLV